MTGSILSGLPRHVGQPAFLVNVKYPGSHHSHPLRLKYQ